MSTKKKSTHVVCILFLLDKCERALLVAVGAFSVHSLHNYTRGSDPSTPTPRSYTEAPVAASVPILCSWLSMRARGAQYWLMGVEVADLGAMRPTL